jgi:hypothetical protein
MRRTSIALLPPTHYLHLANQQRQHQGWKQQRTSLHTIHMYIPIGPFPDVVVWPFGSVRISYLLDNLVRAAAAAAAAATAAAAAAVLWSAHRIEIRLLS